MASSWPGRGRAPPGHSIPIRRRRLARGRGGPVSGTWRRFTPLLAAIVVLGLLWPEPADASPAPPAPRLGAPALSLPVVRHAVPDAAQTAAAVPASRGLLP